MQGSDECPSTLVTHRDHTIRKLPNAPLQKHLFKLVVPFFITLFGLFSVEACTSTLQIVADQPIGEEAPKPEEKSDTDILASLPELEREFRGVWVATVDNIDWPSEPGLPTGVQKTEMRALLDRAVDLNLNAIVFQVRPSADALYDSPFEPWSAYLTGKQGKAPDPYYDPLEFTVEEAHRRGLELHAWFNPYRAYHPTAREEFTPLHVTRLEMTVRYGNQRWMDPGSEEATRHSLAVILDVVNRYDIDGVHLDDYFYPYPIQNSQGRKVPFPDNASWEKAESDSLSRDDWRRRNVDRFVRRLYRGIKDRKPWVKFGISPFGIWRPGHPEQITGFDAYARLYADARKWLVEGWVDYFSPQLYWEMDSRGQSYPVLLDWWIEQNDKGRHIWPGNFTSRVRLGGDRNWPAEEVLRQIAYTQGIEGAQGNIHFSMKALMPARHRMGDKLAALSYRAQAVVPESPWLGNNPPSEPVVSLHQVGDHVSASFLDPEGESVWLWAVRTFGNGEWKTEIVPGWRQAYRFKSSEGDFYPEFVAVSAINRKGTEGPISFVRLPVRAAVDDPPSDI